MIKTTRILLLALLLAMIFIFSCSVPIEEELAGHWSPEDVSVEADPVKVTKQQVRATEKMEWSVSFKLNEDFTMSAYTGGATLTGTWTIVASTNEVFVQFEGVSSAEPVLLGVYTDGTLVQTHEPPNMKIVTTYTKK